MKASTTSGLGAVLLATVGLSLKGIWARLAYASGFDVSDVLLYRALLSLPLIFLGGLLIVRQQTSQHPDRAASTGQEGRRPSSIRERSRPLSRAVDPEKGDPTDGAVASRSRFWPSQRMGQKRRRLNSIRERSSRSLGLHRAYALGAFFALGMFADFQAIKSVGAGVSRVVLFAFPLLVMGLDGLILGDWPRKKSLLAFGIAWTGLLLIASAGASNRMGAGLGWALGSLVAYALFVWFSGRLALQMGTARLTFHSNLSTCLCVVTGVVVSEGFQLEAPAIRPLAWVGVMVLVSTVVPYYLMNEAIVRLGAARASLIAMSGPVLTLIAAFLVLGETLSLVQLLGSAALLVGVNAARRSAETPSGSCEKSGTRKVDRRIPPTDSPPTVTQPVPQSSGCSL